MATEITIPDFDFSGFYYPQLLEALIEFKRRNVPELTDESAFEPFIQLLRATALVGHQNNVLIDLVANESTLPTAKLVESVRNMLRLIDFELRTASPAQADLVYELSKIFVTSAQVVPDFARAATAKEGDNPVIFFEALTGITIDPTDEHTYVLAEESGVFTDFTIKANSPTPVVDDFIPWATPTVGDILYWGHRQAMWNALSVVLASPAANIVGVFEVFDGDFSDGAPTSVADLGGTIELVLTSILGSTNRQGTTIRVALNESGAFEDLVSTWTGSANIVTTTGLLGQTTPTTDPTKYTVGSDWKILENATDEPANFTVDGKVEYTVPQSITEDWNSTEVDGKEAIWLRYRITEVSTPTPPTIRRTRMDEGKTFVKLLATQGKLRTDDPLGSSTGLANQEFVTTQDNFITGSQTVNVDGIEWTSVSNFLNSLPGDRHYVIELGENDRATVVFGDGVNGRIPAIGVGNINITYRHFAQDDGNVGALSVTVDKTGLTFVNKIFNPRQASGWSEAQGASEASLEQAKVEGPASLRTKDVAIGPDDVEELTVSFTDSNGASPFSRAKAFEETFGPKTVEDVVVAKGGALATALQLAELELFFNGDKFAVPPVEKHIVANQEVTALNYTQKPINIVAVVTGKTTVAAVTNRLLQILQPEALKDDGVTFEWEFGGEVPRSRLSHEIFETDESITKVVLTSPPSDVPLTSRELPVAGTISIVVVAP